VPPSDSHPGTRARHWLGAFGRFWWEFLIGDTPELFVGAAAAVVAVAGLAHHGAARAITVGSLPVLVTVLLVASVSRARRTSAAKNGPGAPGASGAPATE